MSGFSLAHYADQAVASAADADYDAIAKEMAKLIPPADHEAMLIQLCRVYLVSYKPRLSKVRAESEREARRGSGGQRSAKVAAYQQHARFFHILVQTGANTNKWMGDCTYEDLMHAATARRDQAAACAAAADEHEEIAGLLKRHKVKTVRELPAAVVEQFLQGRGRRRAAA